MANISATPEPTPKRSTTALAKARIEALWQELAHDPGTRAIEAAKLCQQYAPELADWLEELITAETPECFGRTSALSRLKLFCNPQPSFQPTLPGEAATASPIAAGERKAHPLPKTKAPSSKKRTQKSSLPFGDLYQRIFGVMPVLTELVRVDWELGRLAIALHRAAEFRLWSIGRDITRQQSGSGVILKAELVKRTETGGIGYTRRHFNRLLAAGEGLFWHVHGEKLYLRSSQKVAQAITEQAREQGLLVETNLPGVRDVYVEVYGSLERFEAMLYAAWIAGRGQKRELTISREVLSQLFGRHENTIRRWEKNRLKMLIARRANFAQCPDIDRYFYHIPAHSQPYVCRVRIDDKPTEEIVRIRWQLPNTYTSSLKPHAHRGQAGKVRRKVTTDIPADTKRGGPCRHYLTPEELKRRFRSRAFRLGLKGDVNRPVMVFLGMHQRSKQGMFEITNSGFWFTHANERVKPEREQRFFREQEQSRERFYETRAVRKGEENGTFL